MQSANEMSDFLLKIEKITEEGPIQTQCERPVGSVDMTPNA